MILKTIFPLFFTLVIGIFPLRVLAMEGMSDDESSEYSSHSESTLQNSDTERDQAAKTSGVKATAGAGSGLIDDDDTTQTGVLAVNLSTQKAGPDDVNLDENYLIETWNEAQEATEHLRQEKESLQKKIADGSLSSYTRNRIRSNVECDRATWQEISRRYGKFIKNTREDAISAATQQYVLNLITASNKALGGVQEIFDVLSRGETSRGASKVSKYDSNTDKYFDNETQNNLLTTAKAKVATKAWAKKEEAVTTFNEVRARDLDDSASVAGSIDSEWILNTMHADYQHRVASGLMTSGMEASFGHSSYSLEKLEELQELASKAETKANAEWGWKKYLWEASSDSWNDAVECLSNLKKIATSGIRMKGIQTTMERWREASEQSKESAKKYEKAAQAVARNDEKGTHRLHREATQIRLCAQEEAYAAYENEAEAAGNGALFKRGVNPASVLSKAKLILDKISKKENSDYAEELREAAAVYERSLKPYTKALKAYAAGSMNEGQSWSNAGNALRSAAGKLEKAVEAEKTGRETLAEKWREVAELYQRPVELFTKAAKAYAIGKTDEGASWNHASFGLFFAAEKQGKAVEAEETGRETLAEKWQEVAELYQRSVEPHTKAAQAYEAESTNEAQSWNNAGSGLYNAAENLEQAFYEYEKEWGCGALSAHKLRKKAQLQERSAEFYIKAAKLYSLGQKADAAGKKDEGKSWSNAGDVWSHAIHELNKALEQEEHGNRVAARKWEEEAMLHKRSVELFTQAAEAYAAGRNNIANCWYYAAKKREKALEEKKDPDDNLTKMWENAAIFQGAAALQNGTMWNSEECNAWRDEKNQESFVDYARQILLQILLGGMQRHQRVDWLDAQQARLMGKPYDTRAAEAREAEKWDEAWSWDRAGNNLRNAVESLGKAIESEQAGNEAAAARWLEAAELQQESVKHYVKAAIMHVAGKYDDAWNWNIAGEHFYTAAKALTNENLSPKEKEEIKSDAEEAKRLAANPPKKLAQFLNKMFEKK